MSLYQLPYKVPKDITHAMCFYRHSRDNYV